MYWMNMVVNYCGFFEYEVGYCERLKSFLEVNLEWMQEEMELNLDLFYWYQVWLIFLQLKGLEDSYEGCVSFLVGKFIIKFLGFFLLQFFGDLEDLELVLNKIKIKFFLGFGFCFVFIKLFFGQSDFLVVYNIWNNYQYMLCVIKKYWFQFWEGFWGDYLLVFGNKLVFFFYFGIIFFCDDFYILGSGLVILEIIIGNKNLVLWKYVWFRGCVLEWVCNIVVNCLVLDGVIWVDIFKRFNSGMYNNQWMIVDYKVFILGGFSFGSWVFIILEQIFGMVVVVDKILEFYQKIYWVSYNILFFEIVFNVSGLQVLVVQYGDWFFYDGSFWVQIFWWNQLLV